MNSWLDRLYNNSPVLVQNIMVSLYGLLWRLRRFGGHFNKELKKAKQREKFSEEQWINYQQEQLRKLLIHCYKNVPYYQNKFFEKGLYANFLKNITLQELKLLPVLTKEDLRIYGENQLISKKKNWFGQFYQSSGSTGTPVSILISPSMHQFWSALYEARVRSWAGINYLMSRGMIGGRRIVPSADDKGPFHRYNYFEKQIYFSSYHISPSTVYDYVNAINQSSISYMAGYAMSNYFLARFIQEQKLNVKPLKAVLTSSEKLTTEMRELLEKTYQCKVYDGWSGIEACALVSECEYGNLHISPDAGIIELLDDNLNPVGFNKEGKVYCTGLLNYNQPLIRYAIGDTMILTDKKCKCERNMPVIKEIVGRVEDIVYGNDGREMVRFHSVFVNLKSVQKAQIVQEKLGEIMVNVVCVNKKMDEQDKLQILDRIKSQLGEIMININVVDEIPLTANGKFKAVVSKVKRGKNNDIKL